MRRKFQILRATRYRQQEVEEERACCDSRVFLSFLEKGGQSENETIMRAERGTPHGVFQSFALRVFIPFSFPRMAVSHSMQMRRETECSTEECKGLKGRNKNKIGKNATVK